MPKKRIRLNRSFTKMVKEEINSKIELNISICNVLHTNPAGLGRMLERDSQTLMHISIIKLVADKLGMQMQDVHCEISIKKK